MSILRNRSQQKKESVLIFKLKQGPAKTRNAIALLKVLNYPEKLVADAKEAATFFDQHRKWEIFD